MTKRISVSERRGKDARGLDAFFSTSKNTGEAETVDEANAQSIETENTSKPTLAKVTLYIRPDQVLAIESIQLEQRQKTGKKPDKSDLIQEALDLLVEHYRAS